MKNDQQRFEEFVQQVISNRELWLLQADEGQFALLGDDTGSSFIPVWASEEESKRLSKPNGRAINAHKWALANF